MNKDKLRKEIELSDDAVVHYYFSPSDGAHYVILEDGSWQFVSNKIVKMFGDHVETEGNSVKFFYTMNIRNPEKSLKLVADTGVYELYQDTNLFGWGETDLHYYNKSFLPWDNDECVYVDLAPGKIPQEKCIDEYKKILHEGLSKRFEYDSPYVARYYTNLVTNEAFILLEGGAWQFIERDDVTGELFVSEYGITYDWSEEAMDMEIFCRRDSNREWEEADPDDDDSGFPLFIFDDFFGKGEEVVSYKDKLRKSHLETMFFGITDFGIAPSEARSFFGYDTEGAGEFAIQAKHQENNKATVKTEDIKNSNEPVVAKKFGAAKTIFGFVLILCLIAGFYFVTLKIAPDVLDKNQMIFFSFVWFIILLCFIFPFLSIKNQKIEISKNKIIYTNMFKKKTTIAYKDIFGIYHQHVDKKTGDSIIIYSKDPDSKNILLYEKQYKDFAVIDQILTNNLQEVTFEEYVEHVEKLNGRV